MGTITEMDRTIKEAASDVLLANEEYNTLCRYTPFSNWYKGDHKKAATRLRKAVRELRALLRACGEYGEALAPIGAFLAAKAGHNDGERSSMITAVKAALAKADLADEEQEWVDGTHPAFHGDRLAK